MISRLEINDVMPATLRIIADAGANLVTNTLSPVHLETPRSTHPKLKDPEAWLTLLMLQGRLGMLLCEN